MRFLWSPDRRHKVTSKLVTQGKEPEGGSKNKQSMQNESEAEAQMHLDRNWKTGLLEHLFDERWAWKSMWRSYDEEPFIPTNTRAWNVFWGYWGANQGERITVKLIKWINKWIMRKWTYMVVAVQLEYFSFCDIFNLMILWTNKHFCW